MCRAPSLVFVVVLGCTACATTTDALPKWDESAHNGDAEEQAANDPEQAMAVEDGGDAELDQSDPSQAPGEAAGEDAAPVTAQLPAPVHRKVNRSCGNDPGVGQRLKSFALKTPDGKTISPGKFRGRVLLVNFWGTWCKPCLKELPEFDRLYRRYRKHGLTLVAIATDEDPAPVKDFMGQRKLAARVAIGGESYANQYQSDKFPFSFVVDTRGVIKASFRGFKPECMGKLEADVRKELQKRTGK